MDRHRQKDGRMDRHRQMDGRMDRHRQIDGHTQADGWTDRRMDRQRDGQTEG